MYITPKYKWTTYTSLVPENKMNEALWLTGYPSWPDLELVSVSTSSKAQSHKMAPSDMRFYSTWLQISVFPWPPHTFRFNNLLECLKELRKVLYFWLHFYYKGYRSGAAQWRDISGDVWKGLKYEASVFSRPTTLPVDLCVSLARMIIRASMCRGFVCLFVF